MTYIQHKERVNIPRFYSHEQPPDLIICRKRSDGRIKRFASIRDMRAWNGDEVRRNQYFLELMYDENRRKCNTVGSSIPVAVLIDVLCGTNLSGIHDAHCPYIRIPHYSPILVDCEESDDRYTDTGYSDRKKKQVPVSSGTVRGKPKNGKYNGSRGTPPGSRYQSATSSSGILSTDSNVISKNKGLQGDALSLLENAISRLEGINNIASGCGENAWQDGGCPPQQSDFSDYCGASSCTLTCSNTVVCQQMSKIENLRRQLCDVDQIRSEIIKYLTPRSDYSNSQVEVMNENLQACIANKKIVACELMEAVETLERLRCRKRKGSRGSSRGSRDGSSLNSASSRVCCTCQWRDATGKGPTIRQPKVVSVSSVCSNEKQWASQVSNAKIRLDRLDELEGKIWSMKINSMVGEPDGRRKKQGRDDREEDFKRQLSEAHRGTKRLNLTLCATKAQLKEIVDEMGMLEDTLGCYENSYRCQQEEISFMERIIEEQRTEIQKLICICLKFCKEDKHNFVFDSTKVDGHGCLRSPRSSPQSSRRSSYYRRSLPH